MYFSLSIYRVNHNNEMIYFKMALDINTSNYNRKTRYNLFKDNVTVGL